MARMSKFDILETTEEGELLLNKRRAKREVEEWFEIFELSGLSECGPHCAYCGHQMVVVDDSERTDDDELIFRLSLKYCRNCRNWVWNCYDWVSHDIAHLSDGCPPGPLEATAWSKIADFNQSLPNGISSEIAQAFRQDSKRWHMVSPSYLEHFLADAFRSTGNYCEVKHIGRPGDGGVDIVLIDAENRKWLVSVKRRETETKVEPVSTLRDILGAMVLEGSSHAIIATTAGRFSVPARTNTVRALQKGMKITLMDKSSLNQLIGSILPEDSWEESIAGFSIKAVERIRERLPSDKQMQLFSTMR